MAANIETAKEVQVSKRFDLKALIPLISILIALAIEVLVPNNLNLKYRELQYFRNFLITALIIITIAAIGSIFIDKLREKLVYRSKFIAGVFVILTVINLVTAKWLLLPQVYFPSLARIIGVFFQDTGLIASCIGSSFILLVKGIIIGLIIGLISGIAVGWSKEANYWIYPFIRITGPIPASTWTPLALIVFPNAQSAAVFLIAFGVWFQITILTASGIQAVKKAYFEVSSTLGASDLQNLFKIALPAALPSIFIGLFNATCSSFVALMAAEMIGCKSGLGWYVNWEKNMLSYANVYAGLIVIAVFCYILVTVQFRVRDKFLSWQEGVVKW